MKKLYSKIIACALVASSQLATAQCDFTINGYDSWGDGWNGGSVDIDINGNVTNFTFTSGTFSSLNFTVNDGDAIEVTWNPGSFTNEVTYEILDNAGNVLFSDGPSPQSGLAYTGTAGCITCGAPSNVTAVLDNDSLIINWAASTIGALSYEIEYGPSGFTPGQGTISTGITGLSDTLSGLTEVTDYDVYVFTDCGADSSNAVGPVTFTTLPNCAAPTNFSGLSLNADSVSLSWTAGGPETEWAIEYGLSGFTPGQSEGTVVNVSNDLFDTITGLQLSAIYDFYLVGLCSSSDSSLWVGPVTLNTPLSNDDVCDAIELPVDGSTFSSYTTGSTSQGEPIQGSGGSSVWFYFVHPASQGVTASLCGSGYDTKIYGYSYDDCSDFSGFTTLGYNDDFCSTQSQIDICGNPGDTVLVMVDGFSGATGNFVITLSEINLNAGTNAAIQACSIDSVELYSVINDTDSTGYWDFSANPNAIVSGDMFDASSVAIGTHEVNYIVSVGCAADTSIATIDVLLPGATGTAVDPFDACNTGDVFLPDGLTGLVEAGGTWNDDSNTGLLAGAGANVFVANGLPVGTYPFTYTVDNGVCPPASTTVTVTLNNCVGVEENDITLSVYPNPNNGQFFIESSISETVEVVITDVQGKVVYSAVETFNANTANEISLDAIEAGMYFATVISGEVSSTVTFVVK